MKYNLSYFFIFLSIVLVLHHAYIHRENGNQPLKGIDKFFQISDVGNFNSFNHETFILLFLFIAYIIRSV